MRYLFVYQEEVRKMTLIIRASFVEALLTIAMVVYGLQLIVVNIVNWARAT